MKTSERVPVTVKSGERQSSRITRQPVEALLALGGLSFVTVSILGAVAVGTADITFSDTWATIIAHMQLGPRTLSDTRDAIIWELRLPRVLLAAAVGAGLAVSGAVMQALTRNPLSDPYILGLSSGASFGAVIVIVLSAPIALPIAAFFGALAALASTTGLAGRTRMWSPSRTVLAGVAVSALFSALTSLVIFWSATGDSYREILAWLLGSTAGATWSSAAVAIAALLLVGTPLMSMAGVLDAFVFGDRTARALGIPVDRTRWILLGATALLTAALVSVSGSIGFIGLLIPHAVRLVVGPGNRLLLPWSAFLGALFLLGADTVARTAFAPRELPVGIITALVGAPLFAVLLLSRDRKHG